MRDLSQVVVRLCVCLLALATVPAAAQDGDAAEPMTALAHFKAPAGDDFPDWVESTYAATLDSLVEQGKLLAWGVVAPVFHHDMETTHSIFMTVPDWSALATAFDALEQRESSLSAEEQAAAGEMMSKMDMDAHRDELVRHLRFEVGGEGTPPTKFYEIGYHAARPGKGREAMELYDRLVKPLYDRLLADGTITGYGVFVPVQHAGEGWTHGGWTGLADLGKLDAVGAAFEAAEATWTPDDLQELQETFDRSAHTDLLLRVLD